MALTAPTTPGINTGVPQINTSMAGAPSSPIMPPSNPGSSKPASQQPVITAKPAQQSVSNMTAGTNNVNSAVTAQLGTVNDNQQLADAKVQQGIDNANNSSDPTGALISSLLAEGDTNAQSDVTGGTSNTTGGDTTNTNSTGQSLVDQGNEVVNNEQSSLENINDQIQKNSDSYQSAIASIQNGTFPLSPAQQAQLNATSNMFNNLAQLQTTANTEYTNAAAVAADRSGGLATDPGQFIAGQHEAISEGLQKIQNLDVQASQQLATLNQTFEQNDLSLIKDSYDALNTTLNDKSANITALSQTALSQINSTRDYTQKVQEDALTQLMDNNTISYQAKQQALDQSSLDEKTKTDLQTIADEQETNKINEAQLGIAEGTYNATYGAFMNSDGTLNNTTNPSQIPGYGTLGNGSPMINGGNLPQKLIDTGIEQVGGIPVIKPADVPIVNSWSNANTSLNKILGSLAGATSESNDTRIDTNQEVASLNGELKNLASNPNFSALAGITIGNPGTAGGIFGMATAGKNATLEDQLNQVRDTLNESIKGINPYIQTPLFGQSFTSIGDVQKYAEQTGNSQAFDTLVSEYPNAQDFMDAVNTGEDPSSSKSQ